MQRRVLLTILACALAAAAVRAASETVSIGPDSVWNPPGSFNETFHAACGKLEGAKFSDCFVAEMAKAGAPAGAVAFAKRVDGMGFARAFHDEGRVDVVWAEYPYRANENRVCLLVNGDPAIVDVDDLSRLDRDDVARAPTWQDILKRHPRAAIFPGDREDTRLPVVVHPRAAAGETRFLVGYRVSECHACAVLATMRVAWRFDAAGKFLGTQLVQIRRRRG
ncbi:MAG TPA: hypothetical protein VH854_03910 [Thermoanaerobaculia bacterium]|jgi:hypothetical protein|nr:hypothetical protein [Thermoanaerobaculia bacterium]